MMSNLKVLVDINHLQDEGQNLSKAVGQKVTVDNITSNINLKTEATKIIAIEASGVEYNLLNNIDYTFEIDSNGYLWVTYYADKGNVNPDIDIDTDTSVDFSIYPNTSYYELGTIVNQIDISLDFNIPTSTIQSILVYKDDVLLYEETNQNNFSKNMLLEYRKPFSVSTTFTAIIETLERTITKKKNVYFVSAIYYGVHHTTSYEEGMLNEFEKVLTYGKAMIAKFTPSEVQYLYFAVPSDLGDCTFTVNGFEGGFIKTSTIAYSNELNRVCNYDIYRSTYANLGATTVNLS